MDTIKMRKEMTEAPSLNHALEMLLTNPQLTSTSASNFEQTSRHGLSEQQRKILDAAAQLGQINRELKSSPKITPECELIAKKFMGAVDELSALTM